MRTPEGDEATQTEVCITQPFLPGITVAPSAVCRWVMRRSSSSTCPADSACRGGLCELHSIYDPNQLQPASSFATWSSACTDSAIQTRLWISGCSTSRRRRRRPHATLWMPDAGGWEVERVLAATFTGQVKTRVTGWRPSWMRRRAYLHADT